MKHDSLYRHPGFLALAKAIYSENRRQFFVGCLLLAIGAALALRLVGTGTFGAVAGLVALLLGLRMTLQCLVRWQTVRHPLLIILYKYPQRVVWLYGMLTERMPFGWQVLRSGILYFKLDDGDDYSVALPASKLHLITKTMGRLLPHATVGYTEDREARFRINPLLLLRPTDGDGTYEDEEC